MCKSLYKGQRTNTYEPETGQIIQPLWASCPQPENKNK